MAEKENKKEQTKEHKNVKLPFNFRVQQARNYIRLAFNTAATQYDLDGCVLSLIVDSLLEEEYKQQIAYMAEQTDVITNNISQGKVGDE